MEEKQDKFCGYQTYGDISDVIEIKDKKIDSSEDILICSYFDPENKKINVYECPFNKDQIWKNKHGNQSVSQVNDMGDLEHHCKDFEGISQSLPKCTDNNSLHCEGDHGPFGPHPHRKDDGFAHPWKKY